MIIVGSGACDPMTLNLAGKVAEKFDMITEGWNGFNVLHAAASRMFAGLDMGFLPGDDGKGTSDILAGCADGSIEVLYNLAADELDFSQTDKAFVIYQGHHGDAVRALPTSSFQALRTLKNQELTSTWKVVRSLVAWQALRQAMPVRIGLFCGR